MDLSTVWPILAQYDLPGPIHPQFLGNHGGFSGAKLWRIPTLRGESCLREWPRENPQRLFQIHGLMAQARRAGLTYVPEVYPTRNGETIANHQGQLYDLQSWMPGKADFWLRPNQARLQFVCRALASLHRAWIPAARVMKPCPGWIRRRQKAREWLQLVSEGLKPNFLVFDPLAEEMEKAWDCLRQLGPWLHNTLFQREPPVVWVQPCLGDPWHDHLLFTGDQLTGLVDYGSVKEDHVGVDLARMLGSLAEEDESGWQVGLSAYQTQANLSAEEIDLTRQLDRTGVVLAVANWLRWLLVDNQPFDQRTRIGARLRRLTTRLRNWGMHL